MEKKGTYRSERHFTGCTNSTGLKDILLIVKLYRFERHLMFAKLYSIMPHHDTCSV